MDAARLQVEQLKGAYQAALAQEKVAADDALYQADQFDKQKAMSAKGVGTGSDLGDAQQCPPGAGNGGGVEGGRGQCKDRPWWRPRGCDPEAATDIHPAVQAVLAQRDQAAYKLSLTDVKALADGMVYQATSFKPGQFLTAGVSLFAFLPTGETWVEANFKETQRVPLRIRCGDFGANVVSGMSESVAVDTGITRSWADLVPPVLTGK